MKTRTLFLTMLGMAAVVLCGACSKDKSCRCVVTSVDEHETVTSSQVRLTVDGVKCENITVVGDEWLDRQGFMKSVNKVSCAAE